MAKQTEHTSAVSGPQQNSCCPFTSGREGAGWFLLKSSGVGAATLQPCSYAQERHSHVIYSGQFDDPLHFPFLTHGIKAPPLTCRCRCHCGAHCGAPLAGASGTVAAAGSPTACEAPVAPAPPAAVGAATVTAGSAPGASGVATDTKHQVPHDKLLPGGCWQSADGRWQLACDWCTCCWLVACGCWLVAGGGWLVAGGWSPLAVGWRLVALWQSAVSW
jgi:hypothetical protein